MVTVKQFKDGKKLEAPIYQHKQYIVLGKEGCVVMAGTEKDIKSAWDYYNDCEVDIRKHDLYLNDNSKIGEKRQIAV